MGVDVSVILITHNRYEQTILTLYSLKYQTFDISRMEVIVINDASTDNTWKLEYFEAPFQYKYIKTENNVGRSIAKNIGIENSTGEVIIFLDGEVLVDSEFITSHMEHHQKEKNIVVAGTQNHHCAFTVLDPGFNYSQIHHFYSILNKNALLMKRLGLRKEKHSSNIERLRWMISSNQFPIAILTEEDIKNKIYYKVAFALPCFPREILEKHGNRLQGYHLAWMFCITRNASIQRSMLNSAGVFCDKFSGWGYEDWELGYRLYGLNATFIEEPKIITYHQEHPFSNEERTKEQYQNYLTFTLEHPTIEVCAFALDIIKKYGLLEINEIISEYKTLIIEYPENYYNFKIAFMEMLKIIPKLLTNDMPIQMLLDTSIDSNIKAWSLSELDEIKRIGKYPHLVAAFELLISL